MIVLVVSDFHLGRGRYFKNGQLNILEDFFEDDRFCEFLQYYSSGKYYLQQVHLVLNGDILNLLQLDVDCVFTHIIDEDLTVRALKMIEQGHREFFQAIKAFLAVPNKKITYVIGNHDAAMAFPGAQIEFCKLCNAEIDFVFDLNIDGVHIEHGHRFEASNSVPLKDYFMRGPCGKQILNLPWASLFCILVLPKLKKERPYFDKIRPISAYVKWCMLHDFPFFLKMVKRVIFFVLLTRTRYFSRFNPNFRTTMKVLRQITLYPKDASFARKILRKRSELVGVVMGHTHLAQWRRYPEGKFFYNSGTWNILSSVDVGQHEDVAKLTYILIDIHSKTSYVQSSGMYTWYGRWRPYKREAVATRIMG